LTKAYELELWQNLYVMLGGASAALTGLLFVAVSLHIRAIVGDPTLRARAWANICLIVTLVINATVILVPQDVTAVGIGVCVVTMSFLGFFIWRIIRFRSAGLVLPWRVIVVILLNLMGIAAGLSLISRWGGGMYAVTVYFCATLAWVIFNAWAILLVASEEETDRRGIN